MFPGDFLVSRSNTIDKVGRSTLFRGEIENCSYPDLMMRFRVDSSLIEPEYLNVYLKSQTAIRYFQRCACGTSGTMVKINKGVLEKLPVFVPPQKVQRFIANTNGIWDRVIYLTEEMIAAKRDLRKGLMQQLLTGNRWFPGSMSEFKEVKIGDVLNVRKEKAIPSENEPLYSLTIEDGITPKTERYNREALVKNLAQKAYKKVYPQDIVYNPSNLRWGAIAISRVEGIVLVSPIYEILYLASDQVDMNFLALLLCSERQIRKFACMAEGTLVERMAVKIGIFLKTKISIPENIEDQIRISRFFGILDREIYLLKKKRLALISQKKGLMQQLLTGKVRVKVPEKEAG